MKHGRGEYTWPDSSVYKGDYCEDQRHGHGRFKKGSDWIESEWDRGIMSGPISGMLAGRSFSG
jgi:hypothetical protein